MAWATAAVSMTSPSRTAPSGSGDLAEPLESHPALAERQLGRANAGGPDVETDGSASSHVVPLPRISSALPQAGAASKG